MKKILFSLLFIPLLGMNVNAQNETSDSHKVIVDVNDLTPEQLAKVKARQEVENIKNDLETYGEYAGLGKEIGVAVGEGLNAVKDVTIEFADSNVGKLTMALIAWQVIGKDLKGVIFGIPIWLLVTGIFIWSYRRTCLTRRHLVKREGGWWIFGGVKEWETLEPIHDGSNTGSPLIHAALYIGFSAIFFGSVIF